MNDLLQILIGTGVVIFFAGVLVGLGIGWLIDKITRRDA